MAISASSIAGSSTLNELRTQFNNLVTDVTAISGASISYTTLNTTNTNTTVLNVKEDGTIVFEGATDDGFETTITVVDPTADRVITFPNETGTVHTSGGNTTHTNIIIGDAGTIGSASDTNAISISAAGKVTLTQSALGATQTANATGNTALDFTAFQNFLLTATGNITLTNPSTETVGQSGYIVIKQDGTGSRTLSIGTQYVTVGDASYTLSTAAAAIDLIPYVVQASGVILLGNPSLAFA